MNLKVKTSCVGLLMSLLLCIESNAQYTQQLRGTITDQVLQTPLSGATVTLQPNNISVTTDEQGVFRFKDLPVGAYRLVVSYTGFREASFDNIVINSGKETVLNLPMEAMIRTETAIVLKSNSKKNKALNDMSVVSARAFTVEETQKYAAAVNDPLRMATSFPGVLAADDGNNSIIIRGNSPGGLLWRMEGMDIPNPNHFSITGGSGGGISILSAQLLSNSDFVTAAFAAEYGNAMSGVFDLKLRKGNNEKREYSLQAGILGLNGSMEGPFSRKYKGSYLINYRYSTLKLMNEIGVVSDGGSTNFQDLSYNFYLPAGRLGTFTVFGFSGKSDDLGKTDIDSSKWEEHDDRYPYKFVANTSMTGITHTILLGNKINLKSGIGYSSTKNEYDEDYIKDDYSLTKNYNDSYKTQKWMFNSMLNYKFSNRLNLRAGIIAHLVSFNYYQLSSEHEGEPLREIINAKGNTSSQQAFAQVQFRPADKWTVNAGLHYMHFNLNNTSSVEPRLSARWTINSRSSLSVGYGLHSQQQATGVYFAKEQQPDGSWKDLNKQLDFTKGHHYVVSYSQRLAANLLLKTELYYQRLFNVPVSLKPGSTFSTINIHDQYVLEPLANKGKGKNYGIEISLERYLRNNFYLTLSNSVYQSKYTAVDGVERNTRFNGNYIITFIAGKEFVNDHKARTFGINIKTIYAGGLRTTPIDLIASREKGYAVYEEELAYSLQNPAYFRTDLRVSVKWNRKKLTSTLSLDIQNMTNRLNVYNQIFDRDKNSIVTNYQVGLIPVLNYKVEF